MFRKICVVTGTRAEYGLLYWILKEIQKHSELELQLLVTGSHLSPEFGLTYRQIEEDNFTIDEKVEILLSADTPSAVAKSMGLAIIGFTDSLCRLKPDLLLVLGDRYETLAAVQTAMIHRIPIAHLHGGELTEGAIDDAMRHSITKMSHLHFVSTEEYRHRVIQLGEQPQNVFNVGAIGLENIRRLKLLSRKDLEKSLGFELAETNFLVTYHPVTLKSLDPIFSIREIFKALDCFPQAKVIFTYPNADTAGRVIIAEIEKYSRNNKGRVYVFNTLGQIRYLSCVKECNVVIGNSSSGLIEVPSFQTPTVNIGLRQQGRISVESVINCNEQADSIKQAITVAMSDPFQTTLTSFSNPYGDGFTSKKIINVLENVNFKNQLNKNFNNIGFELSE